MSILLRSVIGKVAPSSSRGVGWNSIASSSSLFTTPTRLLSTATEFSSTISIGSYDTKELITVVQPMSSWKSRIITMSRVVGTLLYNAYIPQLPSAIIAKFTGDNITMNTIDALVSQQQQQQVMEDDDGQWIDEKYDCFTATNTATNAIQTTTTMMMMMEGASTLTDNLSIWLISTLKRRKKMMNKHKLRKRRKKLRLKTRK